MGTESAGLQPSDPGAGGIEEKILSAAEQLLGARAVEDVGLDDVAAASGLSAQSVRRYFPSVDRIAARLLQRFLARIDEGASWLTAEPDEDLRALIDHQGHNLAEIYERHGAVIASISEATHKSPEVRALWEKTIDDRVRLVADRLRELSERRIIRVVEPDLVASALVLMVHHTLLRFYRHRSEVPVEEAARAVAGVWSHAIFPDAASAA